MYSLPVRTAELFFQPYLGWFPFRGWPIPYWLIRSAVAGAGRHSRQINLFLAKNEKYQNYTIQKYILSSTSSVGGDRYCDRPLLLLNPDGFWFRSRWMRLLNLIRTKTPRHRSWLGRTRASRTPAHHSSGTCHHEHRESLHEKECTELLHDSIPPFYHPAPRPNDSSAFLHRIATKQYQYFIKSQTNLTLSKN